MTNITEELAKDLPEYYPASSESNNYKFLRPVGDEAERLNGFIDEAVQLLHPQVESWNPLEVDEGETVRVPFGEAMYQTEVDVHGELIVDGTLYSIEIRVHDTGEIIVGDNGEIEVDSTKFADRLNRFGSLIGLPPNEDESLEHYRERILIAFAIATSEGTIEDIFSALETMFGFSREQFKINPRSSPGRGEIVIPPAALEETVLTDTEVLEQLTKLIPASYKLDALLGSSFTYISRQDYELNNHDPTLGYDGLDSDGNPKDNGGTYAGILE